MSSQAEQDGKMNHGARASKLQTATCSPSWSTIDALIYDTRQGARCVDEQD